MSGRPRSRSTTSGVSASTAFRAERPSCRTSVSYPESASSIARLLAASKLSSTTRIESSSFLETDSFGSANCGRAPRASKGRIESSGLRPPRVPPHVSSLKAREGAGDSQSEAALVRKRREPLYPAVGDGDRRDLDPHVRRASRRPERESDAIAVRRQPGRGVEETSDDLAHARRIARGERGLLPPIENEAPCPEEGRELVDGSRQTASSSTDEGRSSTRLSRSRARSRCSRSCGLGRSSRWVMFLTSGSDAAPGSRKSAMSRPSRRFLRS